MMYSSFYTSIQKIIDKVDPSTLKNFLLDVIEENEVLKSLFNSMKEAVIVFDDDFHLFFFNKATLKFFSVTTKIEAINNLSEIISYEPLLNMLKSAVEKKEKIENFEFLIDSENRKYLNLSLYPFIQKNKISGNILVMQDITEAIENKNRLRQAESLAALTTISAGIAHEIKNPLAAIGIHVQLLEEELKNMNNLSQNAILSFNVIREEIERLNNIINDYLFTVRPLNSQLNLVNLGEFLDNFIEFIKPELEVYNIKIIKEYEKLPEVWLDERYFKQALLNLVKNSVEAIKNDGVIKIKGYKKNNYVYISIIDNGPGIPIELQSKIFEPYFTTKSSGTGLGLTIVYKIIKDHKGEITFYSKEGETCFTIRLPLSFIEEGLIEYSGEKNE